MITISLVLEKLITAKTFAKLTTYHLAILNKKILINKLNINQEEN